MNARLLPIGSCTASLIALEARPSPGYASAPSPLVRRGRGSLREASPIRRQDRLIGRNVVGGGTLRPPITC